MTSEEKEGIVKEIENAQMLKELEVLIRNLNDDQLDRLEGILTEDEEEEDTEFGRVKQELLDMGIDAQNGLQSKLIETEKRNKCASETCAQEALYGQESDDEAPS